VLRALLMGMDAWIRSGVDPPPSRFPTIASGQLVARARVRFPALPALPFPAYMPRMWRVDYGSAYDADRIITNEPPTLGAPYAVLVPQVDADGNDQGGVRLPEVAVPLGTFTGWNRTVMPLHGLDYLAGLAGSFDPFARTRSDRGRAGDPRPSIAERYKGRSEYLARVSRAVDDLIHERFLLAADRPSVLQRARDMWTAVVDER
jgi:Alpha/beta hydrolase domain